MLEQPDRRGNPIALRSRPRWGVGILCASALIVVVAIAMLLAGCAASPAVPCPDNAPDRPVTVAVIAPEHMRGVCGVAALGCARVMPDQAWVYVPVRGPAWVLMHEARHAACGAWHPEGYVSSGEVGS